MKKKILVMVMALTLCAGVFSACGISDDNKDDNKATTKAEASATASATADAATQAPSEDVAPTEEPTQEPSDDASAAEFTSDDGITLLTTIFGEKDEATGNENSFGFIEKTTVGGVDYYAYQYKWLVDGSHLSTVTDLFITTDGKALYEGTYAPEGASQINTDDNLEEK